MNNKFALFGAPKNTPRAHHDFRRLHARLGFVALCSALALTACSVNSSQTPTATERHGTHEFSATGDATAGQSVDDVTVGAAWAKSATASDNAMSAVFLELTNNSGHDVTLLSARSGAADMVQLHETVAQADGGSTMQEVDEGFAIPAHSVRSLEPGGDHIMLMMLTNDLIAGDTVDVTLELSTGDALTVSAEVRDYSGAQENYSHQETSEHGSHMDSDSLETEHE